MLRLLITATVAGALAGSLCGCTGVLCDRLGLRTVAFAVAHGALAGAALSFLVGVNSIVLGMIFALFTALILGPLADTFDIPIDMVSMTLFSLYNALTFIFLILSPGIVLAAEKVSQVLWGSVLAVTLDYLIILSTIAVLYALFLVILWHRIAPILFDRRLAEAEGINVRAYTYVLIALTGLVVVFTLRITGGFLVFSLIYIPASSALQLSENMKRIVALSAVLGLISAVSGVYFSFFTDLPVGSSIVICAAVILLVASVAGYFRRRSLMKILS